MVAALEQQMRKHNIHKRERNDWFTNSSDHLCFKGLLLKEIAFVARKMEPLLGAEFKTPDWILYLNVDLKTFFTNWRNLSLF